MMLFKLLVNEPRTSLRRDESDNAGARRSAASYGRVVSCDHKTNTRTWLSALRFWGLAVACVFSLLPSQAQAASSAAVMPAAESIRSEDLLRHIKVLSSDEFEGRGPGTRGEDLRKH